MSAIPECKSTAFVGIVVTSGTTFCNRRDGECTIGSRRVATTLSNSVASLVGQCGESKGVKKKEGKEQHEIIRGAAGSRAGKWGTKKMTYRKYVNLRSE